MLHAPKKQPTLLETVLPPLLWLHSALQCAAVLVSEEQEPTWGGLRLKRKGEAEREIRRSTE